MVPTPSITPISEPPSGALANREGAPGPDLNGESGESDGFWEGMNMAVLTDKDPMPFGCHKGIPMEHVPASYLDWLMGQDWIDKWPQVVGYVTANRKVIDKELEAQATD